MGPATGKPLIDFMALDAKEGGTLIAAVIGAALWIPYVLRSRRVRNTFVK